ncbi:hypothetical protein SAMN04487910_2923 [Aquimarina amphilecti]|uniref:Lipoprotein n=1 Tax=Aquimarina amphilecti TaxID=1038014 RepID=A0A1H7RY05_AQUAM|nr:hypothetical protein [Aquimarina amphilecti]SEL65180.1 hypothetical protein SAMN04487910_2923 [Aquimarina amphilecti]
MEKNLRRLIIFSLLLVFSFGCETDDSVVTTNLEASERIETVKQNEEIVDISHRYHYQGKEFNVTYTLNEKERNVIKTSGDVDIAKAVFGKEDSPKALLFENPVMDSKEIAIKVFDTDEEMNRYLESKGQLPDRNFKNQNTKGACSSFNYLGYGSFYFYKHAYYDTEMMGMRRTMTRATGNHWVGSSYNDNLSSIKMGIPINTKGYLTLREHICYGGKSLNFYIDDYTTSIFGVPNLQWYTLSGWWWWRTSWNDQVSSYGAWCWF